MKTFLKSFRRSLVRKLIKNQADQAHFFCKGSGLEIGAMSAPYLFDGNCIVKYADIFNANALQEIVNSIPISNLYKGAYTPINYLLKSPRYGLEMIDDNTFDFVYSSHSLEHTPNPIWALIEQLRIIKPEGILYCIIPNKKIPTIIIEMLRL